jgi:hypothetical protein
MQDKAHEMLHRSITIMSNKARYKDGAHEDRTTSIRRPHQDDRDQRPPVFKRPKIGGKKEKGKDQRLKHQ